MNKHKHLLIILSLSALMQSPQSKAMTFPWVQALSSWANRVKSYSTTLPTYWRATSGNQKALMCGLALASSYGIYKGITSFIHNYRTKALKLVSINADSGAGQTAISTQIAPPEPTSARYSIPYIFLRELPTQETIPAPSSLGAHAILEVSEGEAKRYFAILNKYQLEFHIDDLHTLGFLVNKTEQLSDSYQASMNPSQKSEQYSIYQNVTIYFDKKTIERDATAKKIYENPLNNGQVRLIPLS